MRIVSALLVILSFSSAFANDGSTPYINVQGVNPNGNVSESRLEVYGKEMGQFFEALPVNFIYADESRGISMFSKSWAFSIWCSKSYERPTNGELRDDHMCTFTVYQHGGLLPDSADWEGDSYNVSEYSDSLGVLADKSLNVLGIAASGVKTGTVYSFYGKQTEYLAKNLIGSGISFTSAGYTTTLNCKKNYVSPATKESKSDYMCSLSYAKK